jgi:hypothetical protein
VHERGRREQAPQGDAETGEPGDGEREPAGRGAEQVAELVGRAARIDITATRSCGAVSMPRALAIIERHPLTNAIAASTASVTAAAGRIPPSTTTAPAWKAVRAASSAGVERAAWRRARNVPGTMAAAIAPRLSATTAGVRS